MTRTEHLLIILAEECAEVAHRCGKALRFGMADVDPIRKCTAEGGLIEEFHDLIAVAFMLEKEGIVRFDIPSGNDRIEAKQAKVEKFLRYSEQCGTLDGEKP